jgi:serine/threonine protein kinase
MLHQSGDMIRDRYRILKLLGQGGMGMTYAAEDQSSGRQVAVKVLSLRQLTDWKALELFEREARVLENLNHPAIPAYLDHFQIDLPQDRLFYLVQDIAEGESLADLVQRGWRANEAEVKQIAVQVLQILDYLHRLTPPVIHRDIKPQNIIRRRDGQIFLVDFGSVQDAYRNTLTAGGTFVGTFGYMPPEQFRGKAYFASDLYALGATLLFLLTGRSPADLPQKRMKLDFRKQVQISPEFADWLERMVEPILEDRFQSAQAALDALQTPPIHAALVSQTPLQLSRQQPKGSKIRLKQHGDHLAIEIPPADWGSALGIGLFALFWNGFLVVWTSGALAAASSGFWIFPLFSIPFWAIGLSMLWGVVFAIAGTSYLHIDQHTFQIGWTCLGFRHRYQGQTSDLERIILEDSVTSKGHKIIDFVLWEGVKKRTFGSGLTRIEKEWLAEEVSKFVKDVR